MEIKGTVGLVTRQPRHRGGLGAAAERRVIPVQLDVTDARQVDRVADQDRRRGRRAVSRR